MGLVLLQERSGNREPVFQLALRTLNQELMTTIMLPCNIGQVT